MKKIIVAGAGHGGISAAFNLARAGYDVTVYEKKKRDDLGYDWADFISKLTFELSGFECPDESDFIKIWDQSYYSPKKSTRIIVKKNIEGNTRCIERKFLLKYLTDAAEKAGVKFVFDTDIICALYDEKRVTGIKISENGEEKELTADLVIDAAGMDSPIRTTLPEEFGIRAQAHDDERFYAWRAIYGKKEPFADDPPYTIYFYHCGRPGMDWSIVEDDYVDILVGGFAPLTDEQINEATDTFKQMFPIGDSPLRGGYGDCIPLGRFLSVMVCNGYAAVGNSAFMTEPLSGSGLDLSIRAGKILADTVIENGGDCSVRGLWKYNYRVFKELGEKQYNNVIIKSLLASLSAEDVDFVVEKKILTEKEIQGGGGTQYTAPELMAKAGLLVRPRIVAGLVSVAAKFAALDDIKSAIPEGYNEEAVKKWREIYTKLR